MKHILLLITLAVAVLVPSIAAQPATKRTEPLLPGTIAPDFTLSSADGSKVTLSAIERPVVLVFYRGYW